MSVFKLSKVEKQLADKIQNFAANRKPKASYQDALNYVIEIGLKDKRFLEAQAAAQ